MVGSPKHYNTKQDFINTKDLFPEETKKRLQELIDGRFAWFITGNTTLESGITDDTHRVIEDKQMNSDEVKYIQMELKEDPNALLFTMGWTVFEAETFIGGIR